MYGIVQNRHAAQAMRVCALELTTAVRQEAVALHIQVSAFFLKGTQRDELACEASQCLVTD